MGAKGMAIQNFYKSLTLGLLHHSVLHLDQWHLVYCLADAAHGISFERSSAARHSIHTLGDALRGPSIERKR
jgi:hypothetical protein